jgi:hypothetical protein
MSIQHITYAKSQGMHRYKYEIYRKIKWKKGNRCVEQIESNIRDHYRAAPLGWCYSGAGPV